MKKTAITTQNAPAAVGPYSQGIIAGAGSETIYVSGQLPIDMKTGAMITDDIKAAVTACLNNVASIVQAGGVSMGREGISTQDAAASLVKITMFLADMKDFTAANEAYAAFFEGVTPPARSCFQVARLPKDAIVEVEAVAVL